MSAESSCTVFQNNHYLKTSFIDGVFFRMDKGEIQNERVIFLIEKKELDRIVEPKEKVQIRIILPNVKTYKKHIDTFKEATENAGGTMAVKML